MYNSYLQVMVRGKNQKSQKAYLVHRFVYECIFGLIPPGLVIDHLDNDRKNNSLINLQLVTPRENNLRAAKNRDYSFTRRDRSRRPVKAINVKTKQTFYFKSLYATGKQLGINHGTVSMCCKGQNRVKSGISKKNGQRYKFEFVTKIEITKY